MSEHNEKYKMEGDDMSQVRSIIKRINEDAPGKEKTREVVVRADGTKVVRVTKKRRVMVTDREKKIRSRRTLLLGIMAVVLLGGASGAYYAYRMGVMSGESYLQAKSEELRKAWGAASLSCTGARIDGFSLTVDSIVAEFPEGSMLERVELQGIKGSLQFASFLTGQPTGDELTVRAAKVHLGEGTDTFAMPTFAGESLWNFRRVNCADLNVTVGSEMLPVLALQKASAYMYYPRADRSTCSVRMTSGKLQIKGWKELHIKDGKFLLSATALEDFAVRGSFVGSKTDDGSYVFIAGSLHDGESLAGPFNLATHRIDFTEFTQGRFAHVLTANTINESANAEPTAKITLPFAAERPSFNGEFALSDVALPNMPALLVLRSHIERDKRRFYLPVNVMRGKVALTATDHTFTVTIKEGDLVDPETVSLRGELTVDDANVLSGTLDYGIPDVLTAREYADGRPDPVFNQRGSWCWLNTELSGTANNPGDNSRELDARASGAREGREKLSLDDVDIDGLIQENRGSVAPSTSRSNGADKVVTPPAETAPQRAGKDSGSGGWSQNPWADSVWDSTPASESSGSTIMDLPANPF